MTIPRRSARCASGVRAIGIDVRSLAYWNAVMREWVWNEVMREWVVESEPVRLDVGASSADVRATKTITVQGK